jgi:hypothetical protein
MHSPLVAVAAVLALTAVAAAQERVPTAGRVVDAAGDPVGNATVTLLGDVPPFHLLSASPDRAVATTDGKGRWRATLRAGHEYVAWAVGPAALHGRAHVSGLQERVLPGVHCELTLVRSRTPARLRVRGGERWGAIAPLQAAVAVGAPCVHATPLPADDWAELPQLPDGRSWLLLLADRDGRPLARYDVPGQAGDVTFLVPPPREVGVRVVAPDGTPAANAVIHADVAHWAAAITVAPRRRAPIEWREVGRTGADGTAVAVLPRPQADVSGAAALPPLWVRHDAGTAMRRESDHAGDTPLALRLDAGGWSGRVLDDGLPAAGARVLVDATWPESGRGRKPVTFLAVAGADGTFDVPQLTAAMAGARALIARRAAASAGTAWPVAVLPPAAGGTFAGDLARLPVLRLRAQTPDGEPARRATLLVFAGPLARSALDREPWEATLDARGEAAVSVEPGRWCVFVHDGANSALACVDAVTNGDVPLTLEPLACMHGRVQLGPGDPPSSVRFGLNLIKMPSAPPADAAALLARHVVAATWNRWQVERARADATGAYAIRFLAVEGATFTGFVTSERGRTKLVLAAGELALELSGR